MDSNAWAEYQQLSNTLRPDLVSSTCLSSPCYFRCLISERRVYLPKDNQTLTLVLGGKFSRLTFGSHFLTINTGIRAPRTARNASEKSEPYGAEAFEFATRRYMQRDVEFEVDTIDKSGGFIGSLYFNKTENAAVTLVKEGLATVHSFSAEGLSWARQLYDAEVSPFLYPNYLHLTISP